MTKTNLHLFWTFATLLLFHTSHVYAGSALPLNKENVLLCADRMKLAIETVTQNDQRRMINDNSFASQIIKRIAVTPVAVSGYDYNLTVRAIADVIAKKRLPQDPEHQIGILYLFITLSKTSDHLLAYKFITPETRVAINNALNSDN